LAEKRQFQAIKGVRDILPPESALWNRVEQAARDIFGTFGFGEIRLPIFEPTELFARSVGVDTDIVNKEMYVFDLHGSRSLERRRDIVLSRYVPNPEEAPGPTVSEADQQFDEFIREIDVAMANDRLPKTYENTGAVKRLKELFAKFHETYGRTQELPQYDPFAWPPELLQLSNAIQGCASDLSFGLSVALRPEATASVVRAYIEQGMQVLPSPVKLYYMGPMFRRERPQKGRYRQFYQIGAEILGSNIAHFSVDADLISMLVTLFERCGLAEFSLSVNSIGCKDCRSTYTEKLKTELEKVRDRLGPDSRRRIQTNPLRVLDSKLPEEQDAISALPTILDSLCPACRDHFEGLKKTLKSRGVAFRVNPRLVRGLDYYVRTTFEVTAGGQGAQDAICGGGRYDGLVELIGGSKFRNIGGIGFAIGEDRLIQALQHSKVGVSTRTDVVIAWRDEASREHTETIAKLLRDSGLVVHVPVKPMSPGDGLRLANSLGAPIGVVVGPNEARAGVFAVRFLPEGEQVSLNRSQVEQVGLLLKFRVLLERELEQLAIANGIDYRNKPIVALAESLIQQQLIEPSLGLPINVAAETFNNAVHGVQVDPERMSEAVAATVRVLDELTHSGSKRRFQIG